MIEKWKHQPETTVIAPKITVSFIGNWNVCSYLASDSFQFGTEGGKKSQYMCGLSVLY